VITPFSLLRSRFSVRVHVQGSGRLKPAQNTEPNQEPEHEPRSEK
jgi:hypothetical protein